MPDKIRKLATVAGFTAQIGVRGQRRTWLNSRSAAKFQMIESATLLGSGGSTGVAATTARVPGSAVWYQHANSKAGVRAFERSLKSPKRNLVNIARLAGLPESAVTAVLAEDNKDLEQKFVRDAFRTYRRNVATYSKTLLNDINKTAGLGKRDYGVTDIKPTPGAMMPEEQTKVLADYDIDAVKGEGIGLTNPTDAIYKIGDKLIPIEMTDQLITEANQHGLNDPNMTTSQIDAMLADGKKGEDELKNKIRNLFNKEIANNWNPAVRNMKNIAKKKYKTDRPTPEQVRKIDQGTFRKGRGGVIEYAESTSAKAAKRILGKANTIYAKENTLTTLEHVNHYVGTFNSHAGRVYHGMTIANKPHVTVAIPLEMYSARAKKAYEFKQIKDVKLFSGYVSLGILQEETKGRLFNTEKVADKQKAAHLGVRLGVAGSVMVNTVAGTNAVLGVNPRAGFSYYIPSDNKTRAKLLEDYAEKLLKDMEAGIQQQDDKLTSMKVGRRFQNVMDKLEKDAIRANLSPDRQYRFWASPFYGIGRQN